MLLNTDFFFFKIRTWIQVLLWKVRLTMYLSFVNFFSSWQQVVVQMDNSFTIWCLIPPFSSFLHHLLNTSCPLAKHLNHPSHFGRKLFWKKKTNKGYSNIKPIKIALYIYTYFGGIFFLFLERNILKWRIFWAIIHVLS